MLLKIKYGLNYLPFSYMLPFLDSLRQKYGNGSEITFFTGDGGDRVLPDLRPNKKLKTMDDLVNYIVNDFAFFFFSIHDVATMTHIKESQIVEELRNILSSYPEKKLDQKYVHFMLYEAIFNDLFESEDRNRVYFWSVSPYYSIPFFNYAMNCSDNNKSHTRLQREFLLTLSPSAAAINKADIDCSMVSKRYGLVEFIISLMRRYPKLKKIINRIRRGKGYKDTSNAKVIKCLQDQIIGCEAICNYFVRDKLDVILNNPIKYNSSGIVVLFTISSLIETIFCKKSTILKFFR